MRADQVAKVLRSLSLHDTMDGYGFFLGYGYSDPLDTYGDVVVRGSYRVERGSGIAGRGQFWRIVNTRTGESGRACKTEKQLNRALREWLAGPKPAHSGDWYPRLNHNIWGDSYIWVRKRW